jgi:hypothetical protein
VPPCFDVWVRTDDRPAVLSRFIDRYVNTDHDGAIITITEEGEATSSSA